MEIADIRSYVLTDGLWKPWFVVVVETENGLTGVGQVEANTDAEAKQAHMDKVREWFVGENPLNIEGLRFHSQEQPWGLWRLNQTLFSGIEIACWDIKGKHHNVPVANLLGGPIRDTLRAYANRWYGGLETPEQWARGAEAVVDDGFDALKFDPFENATRTISNRELSEVEDRVAAIRDAIGPDPDLYIEGHGRFTVASALEIGRCLERYDIGWFEAPIQSYQEPEAFVRLREQMTIPVADDLASMDNKFEAFDYISARALDIIQPDPVVIGGLRETQIVAQMADAAGIQTCPHAAAGPISLTANVHVGSVIPNFEVQESDSFTHPKWVDEVIKTPVEVQTGRIEIPDKPGLGIEFNESAAREHTGSVPKTHNINSASFKQSFE
jgi:galactonate dehydratase